MKGDPDTDPKGLIDDAYRIEGITAAQCRSIFLDWALSLPEGRDTQEVLKQLVARHGALAPDHPMTDVMQQGLSQMSRPKRRGGWRGRARD